MKFTKEQIELAKKVFESYQIDQRNQPSYTYFLDSLLKPETKKIVVEIEYEPIPDFITEEMAINLTVNDVRDSLKSRMNKEFNIKVNELPEVFTREQVIGIFDASFTDKNYINGLIDVWLSERNK
jgi:hypothetical protein